MTRRAEPVTADFAARVLQPGSGSMAARIQFCYQPSDPYAVAMTVKALGSDPVTWQFSRDLLLHGQREASGLGDVSVTPCPEAPSLLLHMTLRNGVIESVLEMRVAPVAEFLQAAYDLVPDGDEGLFLHIDDDVRALAS